MRPYFYLGKNWALTQLSNGLPFFVNTDDHGISVWIILGGTWENFVDDIMQDILRPKDVCLDVGANLGYYTIKMGHAVGPEGRVLAFEPNAELYPFLTENVSINGFAGRVKTYPKAVGACAGVGSLRFDYSNMGGGYIDTSVPGGIEIIAVDELPDVPKKVDFIKIDVEGMEPLAFAGMARLLQRSSDCAIIAEYSSAWWQRFGDPVKLLEEVQGCRSKFWIEHDGALTEPDASWHRNDDRVSYVLLIHESDERFQRVMNRIKRT
jgi:FkbM family methyltransferase